MRALMGAACCLAALPAHAQDMQDRRRGTVENPNEVLSRARPGYDPVGVRVGGFTVLPYVDVQTIYDDNVFASQADRRSDVSGLVTVGGVARSDWSRHSLSLEGFGSAERFATETRQNNERADVRLRGRVDVLRKLNFDGTARIARLVEARGSQGDLFIGGTAPTFTVKEAMAGVGYAPGRISLRVDGGVSDYRYSPIRIDSGEVSQRYRDNRETTIGGRASYAFSPNLSTFVTGRHTDVSYRNRGTGFDLDSANTSLLVGADFSITRLLVAEVGVGWIGQKFDDPRFRDASGLAYDGRIVFNATKLMTFTLQGRSTVEQSAIVGVAGVLRRDATLGVDYEFLRNLIIHADGSLIDRNYRGANRSDSLVGARLGARYLLNRTLSVGLNYQHEGQRSSGPMAREYDANRVSLSLRIQR